jgi:hypothetical protein
MNSMECIFRLGAKPPIDHDRRSNLLRPPISTISSPFSPWGGCGRLVFGGRAPAAPMSLDAGRRLFENNCMACYPNLGNAIMPPMPIIGSDHVTELHASFPGSATPAWITARKDPCRISHRRKFPTNKPSNYMNISSGSWKGRSVMSIK